MYKLPETPEDFNAKYNGSIAILKFISDALKKTIEEPVFMGTISNLREGSVKNVNYHRIVDSGGTKNWVPASVRLSKVVDIEFPMPVLGYHVADGYFPAFVDRRCIRTVHRGWSEGSLSLNSPSFFGRLENYDYRSGNKIFSGIADPNFVPCGLQVPKYTALRQLTAETSYAALSRDFLAVNAGEGFGIFYQNFLIGKYSKGELTLDPPVRELTDVFNSQVEM